MPTSRRRFIATAAAGLGWGALPRLVNAAARPVEAEPHYFLQVIFRPGWDVSYLCDARPLAMTAAGRIQNYLKEEPVRWEGRNGGGAWVASPFKPLEPWFRQGTLAILNGVHMASTFDGHEQNLNFLLTGNPFGGDSFVPHLNRAVPGVAPSPLDYVQVGRMFGVVLDNAGYAVTLDPQSAEAFTRAARGVGPLDPAAPAARFLGARMAMLGQGEGRVSQGVRDMADGYRQAGDLAERVRGVELGPLGQGDDAALGNAMALMRAYFARGITRSAVIDVTRHNLDTHDAASAKTHPKKAEGVVADVVKILDYLARTPLAAGGDRSLLDVTTVVVTSEFGRTMRQRGAAIDNTGTDHNPLANTVLLAGRAVKGGQIIGASDIAHADEALSAAHAQLDREGMKTMGRPFDFARLAPSAEEPAVFAPERYLTFASVANSLMRLYGVSEDKMWIFGRSGPRAPYLGEGLFGA